MPRGLGSASCIKASYPSTTSSNQYLWISDDLLADTFRNFTHRHRRYGSNVPGPLEARKRATKRKNTNLAHVGNGAPSADSAILFAPGSQQGWWQKTQPPVTNSIPSLFPSWLFKPPDPPTKQSDHCQQDIADDEHGGPFSGQVKAGVGFEKQVAQRIEQCSKLKTLRAVLNSMQVNLRQHPGLAEVAFRHVINLHRKDAAMTNAMIHEVLTDPSLNPPGSKNHLILMQELCQQGVTRKTWDNVMFPAIQGAIQLGLVEVEELQDIILILPCLHDQCGLATTRDGEKVVSDYHRLLTSLDECKVLSLRDLDRKFVQQWYTRLAEGTPHDGAVTLLWRLRHFSGKLEVEVVTELVTSKLQYLARGSLSVNEKFKAWMIALPEELRGPAILRISQNLVALAIAGKISMAEIQQWYDLFSLFNTDACAHVAIDRKDWIQALSSRSNLTPGQNLLSLAWTVTFLAANQRESSQLLLSFGFKQQLLDTFSDTPGTHNGNLLGQVAITLDTLPLPGKDNLCRHFQNFTEKSLPVMLGYRGHEESEKLSERDLMKLNDERFYHWARRNNNDALVDLAHSATHDLDAFRRLAQSLIMKNKATFKIVNRILEHNLAIKLTLPHWPDHVEFQKHEYSGQFQLDPAKVTDLIHQLAISFAVSPVVGPRSAFRYVYRLYLYLHRYGAPIHPLMARALWHAGVTRYGKDGTSTAQLEWCLYKIREIEGPNVANMLLWSAGFRRLRGEEMENHQSLQTQEPSLPSALGRNNKQQARYLETAKNRQRVSKGNQSQHEATLLTSAPLDNELASLNSSQQ